MNKVGVIGMGNRLLMDDGIGVYIVEELAGKNINPSIEYIVGETDIDYCLDQIKYMKNLIVIDAAHLEVNPGVVAVIPLQHLWRKTELFFSAHNAHFLDYIKWRGRSIEGIFIGIEPYEIAYGMCLSPSLSEQFSGIVNQIEEIINGHARQLI